MKEPNDYWGLCSNFYSDGDCVGPNIWAGMLFVYVGGVFTVAVCASSLGERPTDERRVTIFLNSVFWPLALCREVAAYLFRLAASYWRVINKDPK